jgi:6-pyruvoyltetrahydropterin/6-carboxytetrahydropterin synthase
MYTLAVKRSLIAQHYLVGGDWGLENVRHSHHYQIEVQLQGRELDQHGYLVDIVEVEARLEELINYYRDKILNDLPEFKALNPSIEHFARIFCGQLREQLRAPNLMALQVTIWETEIAWTAYRLDL